MHYFFFNNYFLLLQEGLRHKKVSIPHPEAITTISTSQVPIIPPTLSLIKTFPHETVTSPPGGAMGRTATVEDTMVTWECHPPDKWMTTILLVITLVGVEEAIRPLGPVIMTLLIIVQDPWPLVLMVAMTLVEAVGLIVEDTADSRLEGTTRWTKKAIIDMMMASTVASSPGNPHPLSHADPFRRMKGLMQEGVGSQETSQ